jgi:DNA-binding response OmpR family regulator
MEAIHSRLQNHTILIVEDDPSTLKWLGRVLSIYFKEVYKACDAIKGMEMFNENKTDIVLADIQMPDVDGLTFLDKITHVNSNTLKIVMTAFNSAVYINRAVECGVDFYLKKPIDIDELLVAISSHLPSTESTKEKIDLGENFIYDASNKMLYKDDNLVKLTKKELLLLELFLKNKSTYISLEVIEQNIWDEHTTPDAIRMVIVGLRKKLYSKLIENLKGLGYRINLP